MDTGTLRDESTPHADTPGLVAQARAAYEQNKIKECLALTKALLLIEPANAVATELQNAIRSDMQRDLSDARALLEESKNKPDGQKYRKAAEIILLKALFLDPDLEAAKTLLSTVRSSQATPAAPTPIPSAPVMAAVTPVVTPTPVEIVETPLPDLSAYVTQAARPEPPKSESTSFTTGISQPEKIDSQKKEKRSAMTAPIIVIALVVIGGGLMLTKPWAGTTPIASAANAPAHATNVSNPGTALPTADPLASALTPTSNNLAPLKTADATPALPDTASNVPATPAAPRAATAETGSLAISSAIAAEIFMGDKDLGSTPTTLQLPAGNQTLEYRHGDLRTVMTHVVKPNETTTALITFDVVVQLNAKPWAQVFIDGTGRLPLGQTPLSDIKVPIGSVLVFENPNFPAKSHKVAVNDKTIQIAFP